MNAENSAVNLNDSKSFKPILNDSKGFKPIKTVDVVWGCGNPPDIVESVFSYSYCLKTSRQLCKSELDKLGLELKSWHEPLSYDQICRCLIDKKLNADCVLIITNPEVVISPDAVRQMAKTLESSGAGVVLPVFNESANPVQAANLPAIYLNLSTYLEVAKLLINEHKPVLAANINTISDIDISCFMIGREFIENLISTNIEKNIERNAEINIKNCISSLISKNLCVIETTALIHSFGRYYSGQREDLVNLVPASALNILDVGCAKGGFGSLIKQKRADVHLTGVEMNSTMAQIASAYYDQIYNMKVEDVDFTTNFDHINCGDIIEHLYEPWQMIKLFYTLLKKDGSLVISIPNAGHWTIVKDLANGRFEYLPVGLLCLTHIRWFTEESIKAALYDAGFEIELFLREQIPPTPEGEKFVQLLCENGMGDQTSLLTNQFNIRAWKR